MSFADSSRAWAAVRWSAGAWLAYGVVELWAGVWVAGGHVSDGSLRFTALLLALYALVGAALGLLVARIVPAGPRSGERLRGLATSGLVALFTTSVLTRYGPRPGALLATAVAGSLLTCVALAWTSGTWAHRLRFATSPWTAALALLAVGWLALVGPDGAGRIERGGAVLAALAVVATGALLCERLRGALRWRVGRAPLLAPIVLAAASLAGAGALVVARDELPARVATAPSGRPDVVLIVLDTAAASHLSTYGAQRAATPALSDLARHATLYTRAIASGDMTLTSHASLFTGLYGRHHGGHFDARGTPRPLAESFDTLAEILRDAGYRTLGVIANHVFFGKDFGLEQGFEVTSTRGSAAYEILHGLSGEPEAWLRGRAHRTLRELAPTEWLDWHYRSADEINGEVIERLDRLGERDHPFFLFVNYMDTHWPYRPPPPFDEMYPGGDAAFGSQQFKTILREVDREQSRAILPAERAALLARYDGAMAYLDSRLGLLFAFLEEREFWDGALIVVTSDHGEAFGEHDLVEHGVGVYQHQVHVPLLIKLPGQREGAVVSTAVSLTDILPTVLDVIGLDPRGDLDGRSLLAPADPARVVFAESYPNVSFLGERFARVQRAALVGPLKWIQSTRGERALFDLDADPREERDLGKADGSALEAALDRWLASEAAATPPGEMDPETLERLRILGYAD